MESIEEIEVEEMEQLKPDYQHYALLDKVTLVEYALILHRINPELYCHRALDQALMFHRSERGLLLPKTYVPKRAFQKTLENAYKTYNILNCVEWNIKYGGDHFFLNKIPMAWLISEAIEKKLNVPQEFIDKHTPMLTPTSENKKNTNRYKNSPTPNHHSKKRIQILKAAVAVVHRCRADITTGASIFNLIEENKINLFENIPIPRSNKKNIALINTYLKPLQDCNFNESHSLSDEEKIWGAVLSVIYNEISSPDQYTVSSQIKNIIDNKKNLLNLYDISCLDTLEDQLRNTLIL